MGNCVTNSEKDKKHYRLALILPAYDPYKDIFDIFIKQFKKCWPDCPYPLVISNMFFEYTPERDITYVIHCGDEKDAVIRYQRAVDFVDADYFLSLEEDRIFIEKIDTEEIEKILDFMDRENIGYYRCNASVFKKKKEDKFPEYEHFYHIPAKEPYGVCGSTIIQSVEYRKKKFENGYINGYVWEAEQLKRAFFAEEKWVEGHATDDRNILHIVHCIEKQKWISKSKYIFKKMGYQVDTRQTQTLGETIFLHVKDLCKRVPMKYRHGIKKVAKKIGLKFVTEY